MQAENKTLALCKTAKRAVRELVGIDDGRINSALLAMSDALVGATEEILSENSLDISEARGIISDVMLDRLRLDESRIAAMANGIREIATLPSPLGKTIGTVERPNGLKIEKINILN